MTSVPYPRPAAMLCLLPLLALTSCGGGAGNAPRSAATVAAPASPLDAAIELFDQGDEKGAQKQIRLMLKVNPNDPFANVLLESITHDPVDLLGAKSYAYTTQPGDTMMGLSQRFLGNRLKFYQLARYNHVDRPARLTAGMVLRIPGEPPRAAEPQRAEPAPAQPAKPSPRAKPKVKAAIPSAPAARAPAADPAAALRLRSVGLAALNQGKVADAVGLLRRARALDPINPLIARDLARAERIARAVRARR